ncbi:MAG: cardiolipin synthase [Deltaproteobacteria bacterium]|nr:cardiolipin synthase [Deltaproteobacteria bacterium]
MIHLRVLFPIIFLMTLWGCAVLPNINKAVSSLPRDAFPGIIDASGPLDRERSASIIRGIANDKQRTARLLRWMSLEEAVTGQPLVWGNKVTLLKDGPEAFGAMGAIISGARKNINLESYIFESDDVGKRFSSLLAEKQAESVQVNILWDGVGSFGVTRSLFGGLLERGGRIMKFRPPNPLHIIYLWGLNQRDHRKILVVDGKIGFTGGVNISGVYSGRSGISKGAGDGDIHNGWRDTHVKIQGPAVKELQNLFGQTWEEQGGERLDETAYFPELKNKGGHLVRVIGSSPEFRKSAIYLAYLSCIKNARKYIHIGTAYFVPGRRMVKALGEAAMRGIDVKIILPSFSDARLVLHAGRSYYGSLLKKGVKIYERKGAFLHSKTAVVDGIWSTVGTANLDYRSFLHNNEVNVVVYGRDFARDMEHMFQEDLEASEPVFLKAWKKRPFSDRFMEWMGRLIKYWM